MKPFMTKDWIYTSDLILKRSAVEFIVPDVGSSGLYIKYFDIATQQLETCIVFFSDQTECEQFIVDFMDVKMSEEDIKTSLRKIKDLIDG